jgi:hypothetical protein
MMRVEYFRNPRRDHGLGIVVLILALTISHLSWPAASAQSAPSKWAAGAGGVSFDSGNSIAADLEGNCYVAGYFAGTAKFGNKEVASDGTAVDIFLVKYNRAGAIQWVQKAGGTGSDTANAVALDGGGNCYVTGSFSGTAAFSGTTLTSSGAGDIFLAKYNSDGALQWVQKAGGADSDVAYGLAVDRAGNCFMAGSFRGSATFGGQALTSAGAEDIFLARYDTSGALQWAKQAGGPASDSANSIAVDQQGRCYVTGRFRGSAIFQTRTLASLGGDDIFLAKFDSAGTLMWANGAGGTGNDVANGVATDAKGDCYVTGYFSGRVTLGSNVLSSAGEGDVFVVKYSSAGLLQWATQASGPAQDEGRGIAVDSNGNCYITGFSQRASFGASTLTPAGSWDVFFAGYSSAGALHYASAGGGGSSDSGNAIAVDSPGSFYVTGYFGFSVGGPATFDGSTVQSSGTADIFVIRRSEFLPVTFSLDVFADSTGSVTRTPNQAAYLSNSIVLLTAVPSPGYAFTGWSGDAFGSTNPLVVVMNSHKVIAATFDIGLDVFIEGLGSVEITPDNSRYELEEQVTLTAKPGRWHAFARWGDGITANPRTVTIGTNNTYRAVFSPTVPVETLEFARVRRLAPVGMPAVFVNGRFVVTNEVIIVAPAQITMQTTFTNGAVFFALDGPDGSVPFTLYTEPFTLTNSATVRAIAVSGDLSQSVPADPIEVRREVAFPLTANVPGGGSVFFEPAAAPYLSNSVVTLAAQPEPGWTFLNWSGDASGTEPVVRVTMDRKKDVRAIFGTTVAITSAGEGSVTLTPPQGPYPYGSLLRLLAVPKPGYYFTLWGNAADGSGNPLFFVVTNSTPTIGALFLPLSANQVTLGVMGVGNGRVTKEPEANVYTNGQAITLFANPNPGEAFIGWSDPMYGAQNPLTITLTTNTVLSAQFTGQSQLTIMKGLPADAGVYILSLAGGAGKSYYLQTSTNLMNWTTLAYVTETAEGFPIQAGSAQRFFRALLSSP